MKVTGFSHIIYTVRSEADIAGFPILDLYDKEPQISKLPPNPEKTPLLEMPDNGTELWLFRPRESNLPAVEFIFSGNTQVRQNVSLLLATESESGAFELAPPKQEMFSIQHCPWVSRFDCSLGIMLSTDRIGDAHRLFTESFRCKEVDRIDSYILLKTTVINKALSGLLIVLASGPASAVRNDHLGLSTLGWFARQSSRRIDLPDSFEATAEFDIPLPHANFTGQFIYDNCLPSLELLEKK